MFRGERQHEVLRRRIAPLQRRLRPINPDLSASQSTRLQCGNRVAPIRGVPACPSLCFHLLHSHLIRVAAATLGGRAKRGGAGVPAASSSSQEGRRFSGKLSPRHPINNYAIFSLPDKSGQTHCEPPGRAVACQRSAGNNNLLAGSHVRSALRRPSAGQKRIKYR